MTGFKKTRSSVCRRRRFILIDGIFGFSFRKRTGNTGVGQLFSF